MPSNGYIALITVIGERTEYLVARVDDLHDNLDAVQRDLLSLRDCVVRKEDCMACQTKWVPRSWAKPMVAIGAFCLTVAAILGDYLDALAKMGWRP